MSQHIIILVSHKNISVYFLIILAVEVKIQSATEVCSMPHLGFTVATNRSCSCLPQNTVKSWYGVCSVILCFSQDLSFRHNRE